MPSPPVKINNSAVDNTKLADNAVTNTKIASGANIDISKLNGGAANNNKVLKVIGGVVTYADDEIGGTGDITDVIAGTGTYRWSHYGCCYVFTEALPESYLYPMVAPPPYHKLRLTLREELQLPPLSPLRITAQRMNFKIYLSQAPDP